MKTVFGYLYIISILYIVSTPSWVNAEDDGLEDNDYNYHHPENWVKKYPECGGRHQSPIDISQKDIVNVSYPSPLSLSGLQVKPSSMKLKNNGHHVVIEYEYDDESVQYTGGPLGTDTYELAETVFHWGKSGNDGGETTVSGRSGPMDMNFLFYNSKYDDIHDALGKSDGILIASRLIEIDDSEDGDESNDGLEQIGSKLSEIREVGSEIDIDPLPVAELVSANDLKREKFLYATYNGSLTIPPCSESVIWLLNVQSVYTTEEIVAEFRKTKLKDGDKSNRRPTQPLNGRKISMVLADE